MPVYQYACTECGEQLEVRQSFTDDALTVCPLCEGRLRKVLNAVGVVFKGSGFYRTDSRAAASAGSGTTTGQGDKSGGDSDSTSKDRPAKESGGKDSGGKESGGKDSGGKDSAGKESGSKDSGSKGTGSGSGGSGAPSKDGASKGSSSGRQPTVGAR